VPLKKLLPLLTMLAEVLVKEAGGEGVGKEAGEGDPPWTLLPVARRELGGGAPPPRSLSVPPPPAQHRHICFPGRSSLLSYCNCLQKFLGSSRRRRFLLPHGGLVQYVRRGIGGFVRRATQMERRYGGGRGKTIAELPPKSIRPLARASAADPLELVLHGSPGLLSAENARV